MRIYIYPHFPLALTKVHICLFTQITNCAALLAHIHEASTAQGEAGNRLREEVNFAFINARLITSRVHLQTAVYQALLAAAHGLMHTKSVHDEILWALNPSDNVAEGLERYGVSSASNALFVVRVTSPSVASMARQMSAAVSGVVSSPMDLEFLTDWGTIIRYYEIANDTAVTSSAGDGTRRRAIVDDIVTSMVAMKTIR